MSSWATLHEKAYQLDHTIINKLEVLLNNQLSNEEYMTFATLDLLEDPMLTTDFENYDFSDFPKENLLEIIETLKKEKVELVRLFYEVNRERETLRSQNFKLLERIFTFENFSINNIDKDLNRFLSRTFFINYELYQKFLQQERDKNEQLEVLLAQKDSELKQFSAKYTQLEEKLLQARDMWKKSILETSTTTSASTTTPTTAPNSGNKQYTPKFPVQKSPMASSGNFNMFTDAATAGAKTLPYGSNSVANSRKVSAYTVHAKDIAPLSLHHDDVEASINDKIKIKIKELMNGKTSPSNKNLEASCNMSNRSILLDKSILGGLTVQEDDFSELEEQVNREAGMMINNRGDFGFKELRSEPNLEKFGNFESRLNKSPEVSTSNNSPKKGKLTAGKLNSQDEPRVGGLGRSASQKTLPPNKLRTATFGGPNRKNTLNSSTANFDPNSSVDNLNNSVLTNKTTSKMSSTTGFGTTYNRAKPPMSMSMSGGARSTISPNVGLISSPKGNAAKAKININSSPVTVKKKT